MKLTKDERTLIKYVLSNLIYSIIESNTMSVNDIIDFIIQICVVDCKKTFKNIKSNHTDLSWVQEIAYPDFEFKTSYETVATICNSLQKELDEGVSSTKTFLTLSMYSYILLVLNLSMTRLYYTDKDLLEALEYSYNVSSEL